MDSLPFLVRVRDAHQHNVAVVGTQTPERPVCPVEREVSDALFLEQHGPDIARRSTNSILANSPNDGHNLPESNPALTGDAIALVIAAIRFGTPRLPPCEETTLPSRGARCVAVGP